MRKILVVSDSHGNSAKLGRIIAREKTFDYLIHCGDGVDDLFHVKIPEATTVVRVYGNMDHNRNNALRIVFLTIDPIRVMIAHGDQFRVHHDCDWIEREGKLKGVDIVLFGHSHVKYERGGRPILFNPGPAFNGSYGIMIVNHAIKLSHDNLDD
ncbi:MAG: hypothetical protein A2176_11220 [Spirochaetes bacterium RBG_13_51_14]|nr:MAG: hypothetical protein A2176_11220 [Spirochaetes bacterium RBG_13_51_14]